MDRQERASTSIITHVSPVTRSAGEAWQRGVRLAGGHAVLSRRPAFAFLAVSLLTSALGCADDSASERADTSDLDEDATACAPAAVACEDEEPDFGEGRGFRHTSSRLTAATSFANHRGRDMFYNPGDDVWVMGKLAYGVIDKDLKDEDVDVYLQRACGAEWEYVATTRSTKEGAHDSVEGVEDTGGRVYFQVPAEIELGLGRHRFELVVAGDGTHTPVYVDIVPAGQPMVVSDVDGTLTTNELIEFPAMLVGATPPANPGAPAALTALAERGYRVMYLTARPEYLGTRTHDFLTERGFPPGIVHTTLTKLGATGSSAAAFKTAELQALGSRGLVPAWGFGNRDSDADTYDAVGAETCVLFQWDDPGKGCRRIESYEDMVPEIEAIDTVCP